MRTFSIIVCILLSTAHLFSQTDSNGNPVFNSVSTTEKAFGELLLISNYYTLTNNIENKSSSVYISDKPTLDQIEKAAKELPSDFYILTNESRMVAMVLLQSDPTLEFVTIIMADRERSTFPCKLNGDITENRANEIIRQNYDSTASIEEGRLKFNGNDLSIISNKEVEDAVWALIKKQKIDKKKPSDIILPSKIELKKYILSETTEGGKLDFFTAIKGKEYDAVQVKPGVFSTNQSMALYKWGRACYDLGVNTEGDAFAIYAEFRQKEELNQMEKEYIRMGFDKELEK